jgi:hypothetical protein
MFKIAGRNHLGHFDDSSFRPSGNGGRGELMV